MKCKKCGASLRETDAICLNCGTLVGNDNVSDNDLYDDINTDEEDFSDSDSDDASYNKELDDLLNSYSIEDKNKNNDIPDYSSFNAFEENTIKNDDTDTQDQIILDQNPFFNGNEDNNEIG